MGNIRRIANNAAGGYLFDDDWSPATKAWFAAQMQTGRIPSLEETNAIDALVVGITVPVVIDDNTVSADKVWSSQKVSAAISNGTPGGESGPNCCDDFDTDLALLLEIALL